MTYTEETPLTDRNMDLPTIDRRHTGRTTRHGTTDRSSLGIFDAQAVADGPVAQIHIPARVPYGFHGLWLSEEDLA